MKHAAPIVCLALIFSAHLVTWAQDTAAGQPAAPKSMQEQVEELQSEIAVLKDAIAKPEGSIQTTIADVGKLKKLKLSGYVQVRYQDQYARAAQGGAVSETSLFEIRRARLKAAGAPTAHTAAVIQVDFAGDTGNGKFNVTTKDAYIAHTFGAGNPGVNPTLTFGQFLTPFGYQLVQSSAVRETPENAQVISKLLGAVEYDRGLKIATGADGRLFGEIGLFNGAGANIKEDNRTKNIAGRLRWQVTDTFDAGASLYTGNTRAAAVGTLSATNINKQLYGIDAQYYWHNNALKAEYLTGNDLFTRAAGDTTTPAQTARKYGYYVQLAHNFSPRDTGVVMYDIYQDKSPAVQAPNGSGKLTAYNLGWIHALDNATRVKLFYQNVDEAHNDKKNHLITLELISVY